MNCLEAPTTTITNFSFPPPSSSLDGLERSRGSGKTDKTRQESSHDNMLLSFNSFCFDRSCFSSISFFATQLPSLLFLEGKRRFDPSFYTEKKKTKLIFHPLILFLMSLGSFSSTSFWLQFLFRHLWLDSPSLVWLENSEDKKLLVLDNSSGSATTLFVSLIPLLMVFIHIIWLDCIVTELDFDKE